MCHPQRIVSIFLGRTRDLSVRADLVLDYLVKRHVFTGLYGKQRKKENTCTVRFLPHDLAQTEEKK